MQQISELYTSNFSESSSIVQIPDRNSNTDFNDVAVRVLTIKLFYKNK